ncbi:helix-turn-helix domain-containing protein [Flagellimonas allohymeniacidonis]|uniref:AraC family transcriptional regulator n=1 Tax=Flagellimonas allohymeniacidonis TaxID=2517819 RepID=A0A4Q8QCI3_9FLAO|nr:helix-turn-helix domain-containing protein [Allomuricauda hymeniacidonis]TAI47137.1 AraC family transcriptional regulator [Allomuricauda hymeniacidonis]
MEGHSLFSILGIGLSFMGLFVSIYYLTGKGFRDDGYFWLYIVIALIGLELGHKTFLLSKTFYEMPFLYAPGRYYNLMLYPSLLFLVWSLMDYRPIKKSWQVLIFLVFSITGIRRLWLIFSLTRADKLSILEKFYADTRPGPHDYWMNLSTLTKSTVIPIAMLVIITFFFYKLSKGHEGKPNKRLAVILLSVIVAYILFSFSNNLIYKYLYKLTNVSLIEWPVDIVFLSLVTSFLVCIALMVNSGSQFFPPLKYTSSALDEKRYPALLAQIIELVETEKLYLDQNITVKKIADRLMINSKYVSQVLNHHKGTTFTNFVNKYRIEEAKKLIDGSESKSLTLEAIGNRAGFYSKSSFIKAFKRLVGKTPGQYLKNSNPNTFTNPY